jgi:hypothetical protein
MEFLWNNTGATPSHIQGTKAAPKAAQGIPSRCSNQQGQQKYDRHALRV